MEWGEIIQKAHGILVHLEEKFVILELMHKNLLIILVVGLVARTLFMEGYLKFVSPMAGVSEGQEYDSAEVGAIYNNNPLSVPGELKNLAGADSVEKVLGESDAQKRIEVDLTNQRLYAYEGDRQVFNFLVSTGKWNRTPTGDFHIWIKLRYTKMSGGSKALGTYYYLPNVPYTMYFYNAQYPMRLGYGIHGTYWHNNFGHPMSHGCINMKTEEVEQLFYWAEPDLQGKTSIRASTDNPGTLVRIYGKAPAN